MRKTSILVLSLITFVTLSIGLEIPMIPQVEGSPSILPSDGDAWTENDNATYPWYSHPSFNETLSWSTTDVKVGSYSLNITHTSSGTESFVFCFVGSQDVKEYEVLNVWMKVNKTGWSGNVLQVWLTTDNSTEWYMEPRWRVSLYPTFDEWFNLSVPLTAFMPDKNPTYLQFSYLGISVQGLEANDNTTILVDGYHFADFTYYATSNQIDYNLLPNLIAWVWFNEKTQTYEGTDYSSFYSFTQTDWTHDYENLESEILGQLAYSLTYIFKETDYSFFLDKLDNLVSWLLKLQYNNASSEGHGGFYQKYDTIFRDPLSDTYNGWILAGLSVYYSISGSQTVKNACDDLRGFLCETLWNETNDWFDIKFDVDYQNKTYATSWGLMPNGAIMTGLGAYLRYVSSNSTVEDIIGKCYNKGDKKTHSDGGNNLLNGQHESRMYILNGMYQAWKGTGNTTYRDEFLNVTNIAFAQNMHFGNGSMRERIEFVNFQHDTGSKRKFDGWGMACELPLLMWAYDETSNSHILDLVKLMIYQTFEDAWGITTHGGFKRYWGEDAGTWDTQMYAVGNAWIYWACLKWLTTQSISQPYVLSTTYYNGITNHVYENNLLKFVVNGSSDLMTTTYIDCGDKGKPMKVEGADDWSWDPSGYITIYITHQSSRPVSISWSGGTLGVYDLRVHVSKNTFPLFGASVMVDGENKTTDIFGDARFEVGYGFHDVTVFCGDQNQTREIFVSADQSVAFNFDVPFQTDREIYIYVVIPLGFLIVIVVIFFLWGKK